MALPSTFTAWSPRALAVLRIITGLILIPHGLQKFFNFPPSAQPFQVELLSLMGLAATLELVGGVLIVLGLFTRPTAFVLSGFAAAAYFIGHAPESFYPVNNGGDAAILYCFVFLYLVFVGPGAWSLDSVLSERNRIRPR